MTGISAIGGEWPIDASASQRAKRRGPQTGAVNGAMRDGARSGPSLTEPEVLAWRFTRQSSIHPSLNG